VSVPVVEEDHQLASHTSLTCTSFLFHNQVGCCTSSHTGDREYHTPLGLRVFLLGNLLDTRRQTRHTLLHRSHLHHRHDVDFRLRPDKYHLLLAAHSAHQAQEQELAELESVVVEAQVWALAKEQEWARVLAAEAVLEHH